MTPADIIALGVSHYGEPWLEKMARDLEYSTSQLWRVVYDGAPVTRRMRGKLEKLEKKRKRLATAK
jgi:hypothetical protein